MTVDKHHVSQHSPQEQSPGDRPADRPRVRLETVDARSDGQRLDNFLLRELGAQHDKQPRALVYRLIRKGQVRVNKKRAKPMQRLRNGDVVRIPPVRDLRGDPKADRRDARIPAGWLERAESLIRHEDEALLVVDKPAGLAAHAGSGYDFGLIELLRAARPDAAMLELVHRIDRETSGLIVVAKSRETLLELQQQFRPEGAAKKRYLVLCHGHWRDTRQSITAPLRKEQGEGRAHQVVVDPRHGKAARTDFERLGSSHRGPAVSLMAATLHTGRTHQIRVHCRHAGHPIVGDAKYGDRGLDRPLARRRPGLMLHAYRLTLPHPTHGGRLTITSMPPESWQPLLDQAGLTVKAAGKTLKTGHPPR
ncbi:RluA family pseudouridine synthase [Guyparkeria hydrothermalis]|uniref:RluA family pseudouridine synthase n=1 Tax=Guyparkeria hydrothermalis TaxID=923 RepID=UPI002021DBAF|nr:RluA family pseudouridine synthase [Guyparkeria hydrothermalis]MCL7744293.1 RluA family pseudouridine synthase [Guyparkeria hydrothermalis]